MYQDHKDPLSVHVLLVMKATELTAEVKIHTHVCVATSDRELRRFLCVLRLSEVDPCSSSNGGCSVFANCSKLSPGERSCTCGKGYTGDGTVCLGRSTNLTVETQIFSLKLLDI